MDIEVEIVPFQVKRRQIKKVSLTNYPTPVLLTEHRSREVVR